MAHPTITKATETIHNPNEPRHFMRAKPVPRLVRITRGDVVLAESRNALRVTEVAGDILDPVFYLPPADVRAALDAVPGKTTHCPLKGDASYLALDGETIAWRYDRPLDFADVIAGHIAFYGDEVAITEIGPAS
ncbi:MAG: DUF427 domain-containing protein [Pseudomonadota bacterium]